MLIKNAQIYMENEIIENGFIKIAEDKILDYGTMTELSYKTSYRYDSDFINAQGSIIAPGFVDQHMHGLNGMDFMDSADGKPIFEEIAGHLVQEGITSYLATTMTAPLDTLVSVCKSVWCEMNNLNPRAPAARLLGVHLEGPFINADYAGAQVISDITLPNIEVFNDLYENSEKVIKMVTFAVEKDPQCKFTERLRDLGITPSCGHSSATSEEITKHVNAGLKSLTHFHNAMSRMNTREPGVVVGGLINKIYVEIIADGIHVNPDVIKATYITKGPSQIILVTDSMRAKGLPDGIYDLGGQSVIKIGNECRLESNNLAGSVLNLLDAVKNMIAFTGCSLHEAINMASANPARNLGLFDQIGSIDKGKSADLIFLSQEGDLQVTMVNGEIAWQKAE